MRTACAWSWSNGIARWRWSSATTQGGGKRTRETWSGSLSAASVGMGAAQIERTTGRLAGAGVRRLGILSRTSAEIRWLGLVTLATLLLTELPYVLAYAHTTS